MKALHDGMLLYHGSYTEVFQYCFRTNAALAVLHFYGGETIWL